MPNYRHIALLRGINVGGSNIIPMADLRSCFGAMGFNDVATHIQSGNVVFSATTANRKALTSQIERALSSAFSYSARVAVFSATELERVVAEAPEEFGADPTRYRYDVLFVIPPVTTAEAFEMVTIKPGVDDAQAGTHALYYRRLIAAAGKSHLSRVIKLPIYQQLTIRNWNTTSRLLAMVRG